MNTLILSALNRFLAQDKERAQGLIQIKGKVVRIHVREIDLNLTFAVQELYFEELKDPQVTADVEINVSISILPVYLLGVAQDQLIKSGGIEIKGDSHVASVLQNTLRGIEIDWEEVISKYAGDTVAYRIGSGTKALHAFSLRLRDNMRQDLRDYLQDNIQISATQVEVDQFIKDVDSIRAQIDRLEARLKRLQSSS